MFLIRQLSLVSVEKTDTLQRTAIDRSAIDRSGIDRSAQYMAEESYEFGEPDGQVQKFPNEKVSTICPRSSDPYYVATYYIKYYKMGHYFLDRQKNIVIFMIKSPRDP